ncbi:MAG: DUF2442 domain-containing protein [Spartobacteria bacterium]
MTTLVLDRDASRARAARVTEEAVFVELADGRTISAPLAWYPRLVHGTATERANLELIGNGEGIHWPDLDEDLSVEGILAGRPSRERPESFQRWLTARKQTRTDK